MKRSEINRALKELEAMCRKHEEAEAKRKAEWERQQELHA